MTANGGEKKIQGERLADIGEFGFIRRMLGKTAGGGLNRPSGVIQGPGDDAAVFSISPDRVAVVTADMMVEGIHFLRDRVTGEELGHKCMAVNLSDMAAMGAAPREAFVSVALPADCPLDYLEALYEGMDRLAGQYNVNILGGDTTGSRSDLFINITLTGEARADEIRYRSGACPGDRICVTGPLGDSRAGLRIITENLPADTPEMTALRTAHCAPMPEVEAGSFFAASPAARAMMDISDGLSSDIGHILEQSRTGARLDADRLPVSPALIHFCRRHGGDPVEMALAGGEDYVLLATVAPEAADELCRAFEDRFRRPLHQVGEITGTGFLEIRRADGRLERAAGGGWDHFKK